MGGGTLLGHFAGPGTDGQHIVISGQAASGRYVIVQMDNGGDPMNLDEVKAFGRFTPQGSLKKMVLSTGDKTSQEDSKSQQITHRIVLTSLPQPPEAFSGVSGSLPSSAT